MTPSRFRSAAISPVPVLRGIRTTLSSCSGPFWLASRSSTPMPKTAATANAISNVRKPLKAERNPPRGFLARGGGGGAAMGLMASLGERGASRCGAPAEGAGGEDFFLPNIAMLKRAHHRVNAPSLFAAPKVKNGFRSARGCSCGSVAPVASRWPANPSAECGENPCRRTGSGGPAENQRRVRAAEAERIRQDDVDLLLLGRVRHEVDRGFDGRVVEVERRRNDLITDRKDREDRLDRARGSKQVAGRRFRRGHRKLRGRVPDDSFDRLQF